MHDFVGYLLYLLRSALLPAALAVLTFAVLLVISYRMFQRRHKGSKKFPCGRAVLSLMLVGYLAILIYVTLFRTSEGRVAHKIMYVCYARLPGLISSAAIKYPQLDIRSFYADVNKTIQRLFSGL